MSQAGKYFDGTPIGDLETLTGDTGGPVPGDANHNINILGIDGLVVDGDPGTNTLTIRGAVGDILQSLTGNTGDVVFPDPVTYNINILGANGITIDGDNPTHTLTVDGSAFVRTLTGDNPDAVPPDGAGNINIVGSGGITVTGDIPTNTLTINASGFPTYEEGDWTPVWEFVGQSIPPTYTVSFGKYIKIGNLVYINAEIIQTAPATAAATALAQISNFPFSTNDYCSITGTLADFAVSNSYSSCRYYLNGTAAFINQSTQTAYSPAIAYAQYSSFNSVFIEYHIYINGTYNIVT